MSDLPGEYVVSLVVTDQNGLSSAPDTVTVSSLNVPPTADAGFDQGAIVGDFLTLDGSASSDADFDVITYSWSLTSVPSGSTAALTFPNSSFSHLIPDLPGIYTAQLIVNDGFADSTPDEALITIVTAEAFAEVNAIEAINAIGALPIGSVTTKGNQTALGQHLSQVVSALQNEDLAKAIMKLTEAIERSDGCTLRGAPDAGTGPGPQPKKDYITDCVEQEAVYVLLTEALAALSP
jgi:CBS domain-containing protein